MRASMRSAISGLCAAACVLFCGQAATGEQIQPLAVQKAAQASFPEFLEFLSLPNDAVNAADVQKNADWAGAAKIFGVGFAGVFVTLAFLMGSIYLSAAVFKRLEARKDPEKDKE